MKYLIIGGSAAGVAAAKEIRQNDPDGEITIVTKDAAFYSRCQLHLVAAGVRGNEQVVLAAPGWHERLNISLITGAEAAAMDAGARTVTLTDGQCLSYDRLLIATGSRTFFPPVEGLKGANTVGLRNLEDAETIRALLPSVRKTAVIGAGLVGVELAAELAETGHEVSLIEMSGRPLPLQLEEITGKLCAGLLEQTGVKLYFNDQAARIRRDSAGNPEGIELKSGAFVEADLIVCAAGVRANIEFTEGNGINVNRGIIIDDHCKTSRPYVFAAGDVTETRDTVLDKNMASAIWPVAVRQGKVAGKNMTGGHAHLTRNTGLKASVNLLGTHTISLGPVFAIDEVWTKTVCEHTDSRGKKSVRVLYTDGIRLKAAVLWGDVSNAGLYHEAIVNQRDISADLPHLERLDAAKRGTEKLSVI